MRGALYLVNGAHPLGEEPERAELAAVDRTHPRILLRRRAQAMLARLLAAVDSGPDRARSSWSSSASASAV